jgi:hypothetical protein
VIEIGVGEIRDRALTTEAVTTIFHNDAEVHRLLLGIEYPPPLGVMGGPSGGSGRTGGEGR